MQTECTSSVTAEPGDYLTAGDVAGWVSELPKGAQLSAITHDMGSQRDPMRVLVGLRAKWTETR